MSARRGDLKGFARETCSVADRKSPLYNFKDILSLEEKYGVKSTWFFQALEPGEPEFRQAF